jgi:hypothetical protein
MRPHEHRFWFFPDSRLGRWAIGIFLAGVVLGLTFPLTTPLLEHLTGARGKDTLFVTPVPYAVILAGVSGVMAIVAIIRDHAVVLLVPAVLGTLAGLFLLGEALSGG